MEMPEGSGCCADKDAVVRLPVSDLASCRTPSSPTMERGGKGPTAGTKEVEEDGWVGRRHTPFHAMRRAAVARSLSWLSSPPVYLM